MPVAVYIMASIILFSGKYKVYAPKFSLIDFHAAKKLMSLGVQFFLLQIVAVIIFSTDNLIITQLFGPAEVTVYNIAYKFFSVITIFFGIVTAPFWSAATEAYVQSDFEWMKKKVKQLLLLWCGIIILVVVMLIFSESIYRFWIGNDVHIPLMLSIFMGVFVLLNTWNSIFTNFINGVGKIRLSLFISALYFFSAIFCTGFSGSYLGNMRMSIGERCVASVAICKNHAEKRYRHLGKIENLLYENYLHNNRQS
jgi:O-antigen/teichoic acid export membrane protein